MSVYVQGVFYLDRSVFIDVPLRDFLAALRSNPEKLRFPWAFNGSDVGGSPAHAIRAARAKGARVTLGSVVPARLPRDRNSRPPSFPTHEPNLQLYVAY